MDDKYQCIKCDKSFPYIGDLWIHQVSTKNHTNSNFVIPPTLPEDLNPILVYFLAEQNAQLIEDINELKNTLKILMKKYVDNLVIDELKMCKKCTFSTNSMDNLSKHMKESHNRIFHCPKCELTFSFRTDMRNHKRKVHDKVMQLCSNEFQTYQNLKDHQQKKCKTKIIKCNKCDYM